MYQISADASRGKTTHNTRSTARCSLVEALVPLRAERVDVHCANDGAVESVDVQVLENLLVDSGVGTQLDGLHQVFQTCVNSPDRVELVTVDSGREPHALALACAALGDVGGDVDRQARVDLCYLQVEAVDPAWLSSRQRVSSGHALAQGTDTSLAWLKVVDVELGDDLLAVDHIAIEVRGKSRRSGEKSGENGGFHEHVVRSRVEEKKDAKEG